LALLHGRQVEGDLRLDAVGSEVLARVLEVLARIEQRLARDAAHVQADATQDRVLLDARGLEAELRGTDRGRVAARARADDDQVERSVAHEVPSPCAVR